MHHFLFWNCMDFTYGLVNTKFDEIFVKLLPKYDHCYSFRNRREKFGARGQCFVRYLSGQSLKFDKFWEFLQK